MYMLLTIKIKGFSNNYFTSSVADYKLQYVYSAILCSLVSRGEPSAVLYIKTAVVGFVQAKKLSEITLGSDL